MSFRTFLLHGPYMSFKGFLNFVFDFKITKPPNSKTKSGKNFWSAFAEIASTASARIRNSDGPDPPVEINDTAALFMESCRSTTPILMLSKYMHLYSELYNDFDQSQDNWTAVVEWINDKHSKNKEWEITSGMNFMQFVDCVGVSTNYSMSSIEILAQYSHSYCSRIMHISVLISSQ